MTNEITLFILVISGPGDQAISDAEYATIADEVYTGMDFWTDTAPAEADLEFSLWGTRVNIDAADDPSCTDTCNAPDYDYARCENIFADPALQALGYDTGDAGRDQLAEEYQDIDGSTGTVIIHFSKCTQCHFAYANFHGGPVFMQYANDDWGPEQIDRVFAHELGHTTNAPDEYTRCNCRTEYGEGGCTDTNDNCVDSFTNCTMAQENCIMDTNQFVICDHSRIHVGWC